MGRSRTGEKLLVVVAALAAVTLSAARTLNYAPHGLAAAFPYTPMLVPGLPYNPAGLSVSPGVYPYSGPGLSQMTYPSQLGMSPGGYPFVPNWRLPPFSPSLFGGALTGGAWTEPAYTFANPTSGIYNQWGYPALGHNLLRGRTYKMHTPGLTMQTKAPSPAHSTFKAFTQAPVFKNGPIVPGRKKNRISVMSGPLVDIRPFPTNRNLNHLRKKERFKTVAKAKPFHHILSGTALGLNKVLV